MSVSPTPFYKNRLFLVIIFIVILILIPVGFYIFKNYFAKTASLLQPSPSTESLKKFLPEQAMKSIYDLSKTSLTPKTATSSFDIKKTSEPQRLSASWETADHSIVNISARYNQQGDVDEKNILLTLPEPINNLTVTSAPTIISTYLTVQPQGSWNCDAQATLCENSWMEEDIKKWVGAVNLTPSEKGGSVFYCEIYPGSPVYHLKTCSESSIIK